MYVATLAGQTKAVVSITGWGIGVLLQPDSPVILVHCQDLKKILRPRGLVSWLSLERTDNTTDRPALGASTSCRSEPGSTASGDSTLSLAQSTRNSSAELQVLQEIAPICVDSGYKLHPFSVNQGAVSDSNSPLPKGGACFPD